MHELKLRGIATKTEVDLGILYKDRTVGRHRLDIVANETIIIEIKAVSAINDLHIAQVLSYLKATQLELAYIFNFGGRVIIVEKTDKKPRIARISGIFKS